MIDKSKIYKNYFATHYSNWVDIEIYYSDTYRYTKKSIGDLFNIYPKDVQILDLWCWFWWFANFCKKEWFWNYTWVDLSTDELEICKNNFKEYTFTQDDIINFLEHTTKKFEIIYLSMVFEHLTLEQCQKLINAVYKVLQKGGGSLLIINLMQTHTSIALLVFMLI